MKKKILAILMSGMMVVSMMPAMVSAATNIIKVTNGESVKYYNTLESAFSEAEEGSIVQLLADSTVENTISLNKAEEYTLDMNNCNVTSSTKVFEIYKSKLNIEGKGSITTTSTTDGAFEVVGTKANEIPTELNIGENVSVVSIKTAINMEPASGAESSFNEIVDIAGKISSGKSGIYVKPQNIELAGDMPVIKTEKESLIQSVSTGIAAENYTTAELNGNIYTTDKAVNFHGGDLTVKDGQYVTEKPIGKYTTCEAVSMYGNKNLLATSYLFIDNGTFISKDTSAVKVKGISEEGTLAKIEINGGIFKGAERKEAIELENVGNTAFIHGGVFSTDESKYCEENYATTACGEYFIFTKSVGSIEDELADAQKQLADTEKAFEEAKKTLEEANKELQNRIDVLEAKLQMAEYDYDFRVTDVDYDSVTVAWELFTTLDGVIVNGTDCGMTETTVICDLPTNVKQTISFTPYTNVGETQVLGKTLYVKATPKMNKPSVKLTAKKGKKIVATSSYVDGADGYQFYVKHNGKVKKYTQQAKKLTVKATKSGVKYTVKVRAYRHLDDGNTYSSWSKVKTVRSRK